MDVSQCHLLCRTGHTLISDEITNRRRGILITRDRYQSFLLANSPHTRQNKDSQRKLHFQQLPYI